ncbi:MAG: DedA family protein [Sulfuricella sp.]|nr:DedA family protein [Sulfuricella sp.]
MPLADLVREYGYFAVFLGTFLEGETILVMAGFAAHRGYLQLPWVVVVAALGGTLGDQLYFYLGRRYGHRILARMPQLRRRVARVKALLRLYHLPLILSIRFMYGLRTVGPFAFGVSHLGRVRFLVLNLAGALLWAPLVGGAGYLFGSVLALFLADLRHYEEALLALMAGVGGILWFVRRWRQRRSS